MSTQNRDSIGRFAKSKRFLKRSIVFLVFLFILFVSVKIYINTHPVIRTVTNTITVDTSTTTYAAKIDSLEKSLVEQIRKCESAGSTESSGLVTFDPTDAQFASFVASGRKSTIVNKGEMSFGTLQFKVSTIQYYYKSLYKQSITGKEAILIALDDVKSGQLAQDILFKSPNLANDWANCANRLSINDQIIAIKKIK